MDEFAAHFRTEPGHAAPSAVRLRRLLKAALRLYGFRCVRVSPHPGGPATTSPAARPVTGSTPAEQGKSGPPTAERGAS